MSKTDDKTLTRDLPEFSQLIKEIKSTKKILHSLNKKLSKKLNSHAFLYNLLEQKSTELEKTATFLFKRIGYINVKHTGLDKKREDIYINHNGRITVIDTNGINKDHPKDGKCHSILKFAAKRKKEIQDAEIHAIFLLNHDINEPIVAKRNKNIFVNNIEDAKNMNLGLLTAIELVSGYKKLKKGLITFEQFDKSLHEKGLIKF